MGTVGITVVVSGSGNHGDYSGGEWQWELRGLQWWRVAVGTEGITVVVSGSGNRGDYSGGEWQWELRGLQWWRVAVGTAGITVVVSLTRSLRQMTATQTREEFSFKASCLSSQRPASMAMAAADTFSFSSS